MQNKQQETYVGCSCCVGMVIHGLHAIAIKENQNLNEKETEG